MVITEFDRDNAVLRSELAELLHYTWPDSYPLLGAEKETTLLLEPERIAVAALEGDTLIGFAGAIPQYGKTGWELHPLVIKKSARGQYIGSRLLRYLEKEVAAQDGIVLYLGTDDEQYQTSLSEGDLFVSFWQQIKEIKNLHQHPYSFYEKCGYQIVGAIPDANGWNKPDILMAKRLREAPTKTRKE